MDEQLICLGQSAAFLAAFLCMIQSTAWKMNYIEIIGVSCQMKKMFVFQPLFLSFPVMLSRVGGIKKAVEGLPS